MMAKQVIVSERLGRTASPLSYGIRAGGLIFTAGILGVDPLGNLVGALPGHPDIQAQTEQSLRNIQVVLELLGSDLGRLAKVKSYIADWSAYRSYNQKYRQSLNAPFPARSTVGAKLLREAAVVEIEAIAGIDTLPQELRSTRLPLESQNAPSAHSGVRLGDLLFLNGSASLNERGEFVGRGDLRAQVEQILDNLGAALEAGGATFADVLKVNGTALDWHGFGPYNELYNKYFREPYATRATIQGTLALEGALIELEAIAAPGSSRTYVESEIAGAGHFALKRRKDTIYSPKLPPVPGPHSHAVRAGDLIYVCGEAPYDEIGRLVGWGDIRAQTRKTMENIRISMELLGCTMDDIVKANVSLVEPRHFGIFDEEYATFFTPPYPPRTTVSAGLAQNGLLVEIEAVAVSGASQNSVAVIGRPGD